MEEPHYYQRRDGALFEHISNCIFADDDIFDLVLRGPLTLSSRAGPPQLEARGDQGLYENIFVVAANYERVDVVLSSDPVGLRIENRRPFDIEVWMFGPAAEELSV